MKELSTEEKAKRYDKAIEKAEKWYNAPNVDKIPTFGNRIIEDIFPELKESKEERIKKALISVLKSDFEMDTTIHDVSVGDIIAWLEKQDKNSQVILPQFTFDDILALQCCMETVKKVQEDKDLYEKLNDLHSRLYDAYHLEKQGKQKSVWHSEYEEPQKDSLILLIMQSGTPVVAKIIEPNHTFNHGERWAYIDDLLEKQGKQKITNTDFKAKDWYVSKVDGKIHNASKIKQQQAIEIPFDAKDSELQEATYYIPDDYHAEIHGNKVVIKKGKQKYTWNEEDEKKRTLLIRILEVNHPNGYFKVNPANTSNMEAIHTEELVSWLKSLKSKL